jgi:hypothetical protein
VVVSASDHGESKRWIWLREEVEIKECAFGCSTSKNN